MKISLLLGDGMKYSYEVSSFDLKERCLVLYKDKENIASIEKISNIIPLHYLRTFERTD